MTHANKLALFYLPPTHLSRYIMSPAYFALQPQCIVTIPDQLNSPTARNVYVLFVQGWSYCKCRREWTDYFCWHWCVLPDLKCSCLLHFDSVIFAFCHYCICLVLILSKATENVGVEKGVYCMGGKTGVNRVECQPLWSHWESLKLSYFVRLVLILLIE